MKTTQINDSCDFEEVACEMLNEFMVSLFDIDEMKRDPEDEIEEYSLKEAGCQFLWSNRAMRLHANYIRKLQLVAKKHFDDWEDLDIRSYQMIDL